MYEDISKNYDVVIIGCGIAGSVVGALLSSMGQKKVLILEGGRRTGETGDLGAGVLGPGAAMISRSRRAVSCSAPGAAAISSKASVAAVRNRESPLRSVIKRSASVASRRTRAARAASQHLDWSEVGDRGLCRVFKTATSEGTSFLSAQCAKACTHGNRRGASASEFLASGRRRSRTCFRVSGSTEARASQRRAST